MSANKDAKVELVAEIKEKMSKAKSLVFIDYNGLDVATDTQLRTEFRKNGVEYHVYKNRLMLRALNELGITGCDEELQGTTAVAMSFEDEVSAARIAVDYVKKVPTMKTKFGVYENAKVDAAFVETLAKIPSKETLIACLMSVIKGPIRGVAIALNAIAEKGNN